MIFYYIDSDRYEGEFKKIILRKERKYIYNDGDRYEGFLKMIIKRKNNILL